MPFDPVSLLGAMLWCWCGRRMGLFDFALISGDSMHRPRRIPILSPGYKRHWESMARAAHFSTMDFKSGFWQVCMTLESQQYTTFMVGNLGFYEFTRMPFRLCNMPRDIPVSYAEHAGRVGFDLLHHLLGGHDSICPHRRRTPGASSDSIGAFLRVQSQFESLQVLLFPDKDSVSHTSCI